MGRAIVLLVVALLIGLALLRRSPSQPVSVGGSTTTTVAGQVSETTVRTSANTTRPGSSNNNNNNTTTTQPLRAKADIKVLVANGTSTSGLAGTVSNTLRSKGYNTLASTNASLKVASTFVYFLPGYDADAAALAVVLGLAPSAAKPMPATLPVPSVSGVNILVVVGPELATGATTSTTGSRTTSTTVR